MEAGRKRLFVGLSLPGSLAQMVADLDPKIEGASWLKPAQMHLTVAFLGGVNAAATEQLRLCLDKVEVAPFFLPLVGVGVFPAKGDPRVLWLGVGQAHPHLFQLRKRVAEAVLSAGLEPDLRPWHPHITLARCHGVLPSAVQKFLRHHAEFETGPIRIDDFHLYSSAPGRDGSVYTREHTVPLRR